jgi:plastocyanin
MLVFAVLLGAGVLLADNPMATAAPATPVDIAFETTSPYYHPRVAIVSAGTPIRWLNGTASHHTVRHDGCLTDETCAFQSAAVAPDGQFVIAPLPPGLYAYHCELHPIMRGTLVIIESRGQTDRQISASERAR